MQNSRGEYLWKARTPIMFIFIVQEFSIWKSAWPWVYRPLLAWEKHLNICIFLPQFCTFVFSRTRFYKLHNNLCTSVHSISAVTTARTCSLSNIALPSLRIPWKGFLVKEFYQEMAKMLQAVRVQTPFLSFHMLKIKQRSKKLQGNSCWWFCKNLHNTRREHWGTKRAGRVCFLGHRQSHCFVEWGAWVCRNCYKTTAEEKINNGFGMVQNSPWIFIYLFPHSSLASNYIHLECLLKKRTCLWKLFRC